MNNNFHFPIDINQNKMIINSIKNKKELIIGIYVGNGAGEDGIKNVTDNIRNVLAVEVRTLTAEAIKQEDFSEFNVIIFSGGSGSKQAESLGVKGKENMRRYIEHGGGYLGICAGAYLATAGFDWALHIVNAETISTTEWKRGKGFVDIELTHEGRNIFGDVKETFKCRYSSGPLLRVLNNKSLPMFSVLGNFRSEVSENGVTEGVMIDTPAMICSMYGKGKVLAISTHPENTPGLEHFIPRALHWLSN